MTIQVLPDETLLEIFDFYRLDAVDRSLGGGTVLHMFAEDGDM